MLKVFLSFSAQVVAFSDLSSTLHNCMQSADDDGGIDRTIYETYYPELVATFTGNLLADIMLYPFETILYRLYLQVIITSPDVSFACRMCNFCP